MSISGRGHGFHLSSLERQIWTAVMAVDSIGHRTFWKIDRYLRFAHRTWAEWWYEQHPGFWKESGLDERQLHSLVAFQQQYTVEGYTEWLKGQSIAPITFLDENYPFLLKNADDKPIVLYCKNPVSAWNTVPIAIVGTRKISGYGRQATHRIVTELVATSATIVSGFMYGIDEAGHRTALQAGGYTVGVLGYGLRHLYSGEASRLAEEVLASGGSIVTEYAPHVTPSRGTFPPRNRIIAGMSQATVVIEAGLKSGSHHTAQAALDYGRAVCAVPGPITNPYSEGTKWLINQGATLVGSGNEILATISNQESLATTEPAKQASVKLKQTQLTSLQQSLFSQLADAPQTIECLVERAAQSPQTVQASLSDLELEGLVIRRGAVWSIR